MAPDSRGVRGRQRLYVRPAARSPSLARLPGVRLDVLNPAGVQPSPGHRVPPAVNPR